MRYDFSDGNPLREVLGAVLVVLVFLIALAPRPVADFVRYAISLLAGLLRRIGFCVAADVESELRRLDFLRIVLGVLVLGRFWPDAVIAFQTGNRNNLIWSGIGFLLAASLSIGFATPLTALLLALLLNLIIDNFTFNVSLGSLVVANCLIPLLFAPAGYTLSVDAVLLQWRGPLGSILRRLYRLWDTPTADRIQASRFFALVAFASITFYSVMSHIQSETWLSGGLTGMLLMSAVANPVWSPVAEWLYRAVPVAYAGFSLISTYGMLLWQSLMLPLALASRWTRAFVIVWGFGFFAFSTWVLSLKRLGVYEAVLWALVFWNAWKAGPQQRSSIQVLFNDTRRWSLRAARALALVDIFRTTDIVARPRGSEAVGTDERTVLSTGWAARLHAGDVVCGYGVLLLLSQYVLVLLPLWPVIYLGQLTGAGPLLQRWIASRRTESIGGTSAGAVLRGDLYFLRGHLRGRFVSALALAYVALLGAYLVRYLPRFVEPLPSISQWSRARVQQSPLVFGLGPVNVFNERDLTMYRNKPILRRHGKDGAIKSIELSTSEGFGSRLNSRLWFIAFESLFCDVELSKIYFDAVALATPASGENAGDTVSLEFWTWTHPTNDEFGSFRYVPVAWEPICVVTAPLHRPDQLTTSYTPAAVALLAAKGADFTPNLRRLTLASRFPCTPERITAAAWYDRPFQTTRTPEDRSALDALFMAEQKGPLQCMSSYRKLVERLSKADRGQPHLPRGAGCESELAIAQHYQEAADDTLRDMIGARLSAAREAHANGRDDACRAAAGDVRRAYFEEIYGPAAFLASASGTK